MWPLVICESIRFSTSCFSILFKEEQTIELDAFFGACSYCGYTRQLHEEIAKGIRNVSEV